MADLAESTAKLQLDEETGEMVSKAEMKKRLKKREKAKAKEAARSEVKSEEKAKPTPKPKATTEEPAIDPNNMFKTGFLDEVFKIRPMKPVFTRFPPEPNGFLHIGHAKAIAVNFGFARYHGGECYLRYDDTNPEAEEQVYFDAILEMVEWLGFKPYKITYSSDNFQKLYDLAEKLIGLEKAYVCQCSDTEIKLQRGGEKGTAGPRYRCKHAEQPAEENLKKFRDMRDGKYKPQEAFLRMKQVQSRVSYEWLNKTLGVYEPMQREYGRLSISGTILSKRKILKLVAEKIVRGWNDPRLYTLIGIKRRGVPPGAILEFVNELGVTTANSVIEIKRFDQAIRKYLERTVPRLMLILDPIPVVIEDADDIDGKGLAFPFSPKDPKMGSHDVTFSKTIYIDRSDFREDADPSFFRLAPGKTVGLLQVPHPIKAVSFTKDDATGKVTEIRAVFDKETKKPKAYIQWVPTEAAGTRKAEVRIYNSLFKSDNPNEASGGFLNDINPDSEVIYPNALVESGFDEVRRRAPWPEAAGESELGKGGPESVRFQAMRIAYFAMDSDSTDDHIILNRIVALKEDAGKS
ncbi:putative glutamine-tRNA ligase [Daldinia childiae]|uniref:putative glutamine-tRNA ligase n=1 Tax=Daldinia childiae TaxID=326645 RepID=UPI001444CD61|nr:putative glutamine-tRNA ligase [Daldinia childiae]KAF3070728.1 putative glutamine-tRNA ligase [Daldinia childiae]